jgi:anti-sigma factor RsiW
MDCRRFRKLHLAYLDDTLSGDDTTQALQHIMACDACAAHDTLVRRSLMIARSMPSIEPSSAFQERLRMRLAECREEAAHAPAAKYRMDGSRGLSAGPLRSPKTIAAVAAGVMIGTMLWRGMAVNTPPMIAMQPVIASRPAELSMEPYVTPALIRAMSTGNPVWPAAMIIEDAPNQFVSTDFRLISENR